VAAVGLEDQHRPRGGHGDGVDRRDDRRDRDRDRELAEELAGDALDEHARQEHGAQHQADRDDGPRHLVHRLDGRGARVVAFGDLYFNVFQHDDGVIDDDADGQHQSEQRDVVQAVAERRHDGKGADERHRHVDHGQDHGSPVLQEQQHDEADHDDGFEQGLDDVVDRLADERGGVVSDRVLEAVGELLLKLGHLGPDAVGHVEGVGAGELVDGESDGRVAVEGAGDVVVLGAAFQPCHVAEPDQAGRRRRRPPLGAAGQVASADGAARAGTAVGDIGVRQAVAGQPADVGPAAAGRSPSARGPAAAGRCTAAGRPPAPGHAAGRAAA
jgi:hypothetical protein